MKVLFGAALGATAMYFFDPELGRTRRAKLQDQLAARSRRAARETQRKADYARGQAEGMRHVASGDSTPGDDRTLVAKIESEVLSRLDYPKGQISVDAVDGVVDLRGTLETSEQIDDLEAEVRKVTGVVDVRSYLHLPGTPAPNKEEALKR